jgi:3-isopropylmalate dehydrogenase
MMFEWMGRTDVAMAIRRAVEKGIENNVKTPDIGGKSTTSEVGRYIATIIEKL